MKTKIFVIAFFLFIFSVSHVYAIDMFLTNNDITTGPEEIITENVVLSEDINTLLPYDSVATNPTPTVTQTSSDSVLTISDIIDVILIAVCIVLIFLGIAILIRCK